VAEETSSKLNNGHVVAERADMLAHSRTELFCVTKLPQ
jgi:hypothetical protein